MAHHLNKLAAVSSPVNRKSTKKVSTTQIEDANPVINRTRYMIINCQQTEQSKEFVVKDEEVQEEFHVDPTRSLLSNKREVQLAWQALVRTIIRKHMRIRDFYDKMDAGFSGSLTYHEFESGLRQFKDIYQILSPKHVESLIRSLFPKVDSEVTWEIFDRVIQIYTANHFPAGSYAEWSGKTLIDTRIKLREAFKTIIKEKDEIKKLLHHIDELKIIEIKGKETTIELNNCRSKNITLVSMCDETNKALKCALKENIDAKKLNSEYEKIIEELKATIVMYEEQIHGKGAHLNDAKKRMLTIEEALAEARKNILLMKSKIKTLEQDVENKSTLIINYEKENQQLKSDNQKMLKEKEENIKSKHILEMRLLKMEQSQREIIKQFYTKQFLSKKGSNVIDV